MRTRTIYTIAHAKHWKEVRAFRGQWKLIQYLDKLKRSSVQLGSVWFCFQTYELWKENPPQQDH